MTSRKAVLSALTAVVPSVAACELGPLGLAGEPEPPCFNCFSIMAAVATSGEAPDPDGYLVSLDSGETTRWVEANGAVRFADLHKGRTYVIRIDEVATNCDVADGPERSVEVAETDIRTLVRRVDFEVRCA
ncbi:MAG TPA: hypothetical protein VE669_01410 [Actinomycetota bacterium]|nr:hypothetical protein [Actinomycetota bacterium]